MHDFSVLFMYVWTWEMDLIILIENGWMMVRIVSIVGSYRVGEMCVKRGVMVHDSNSCVIWSAVGSPI